MRSAAKLQAIKNIMQMQKDGILTIEGVSLVLDSFMHTIDLENNSKQQEQIKKSVNNRPESC